MFTQFTQCKPIFFRFMLTLVALGLLSGCGQFFPANGSNGTNSGSGLPANFVFVADSTVSSVGGAVDAFTISGNGLTGAPNPNGLFAYYPSSEFESTWLATDPTFNFLYVANAGSGTAGSIDLWEINRSNGTLEGQSNSTTPLASYTLSNLENPTALAVSSGGFLYATYANPLSSSLSGAYVAGFSIGSGGTLSALNVNPTSVGSTPTGATVAGSFVYVVSDSGIYVFQINSDGTLTATTQGTTPFTGVSGATRIAIAPNGQFAFVPAGSSGIVVLDVNTSSGILSTSGNSYSANGGTVADVEVDETGQWVYAVTSDTNQLFEYSVDSSTGALTALSTPSLTTGCSSTSGSCSPSSISIAPSSLVLYIANAADSTIGVYAITSGGLLSYQGFNTVTANSSPKFVLATQ